MASRYGRNKRRKHREAMASLHDHVEELDKTIDDLRYGIRTYRSYTDRIRRVVSQYAYEHPDSPITRRVDHFEPSYRVDNHRMSRQTAEDYEELGNAAFMTDFQILDLGTYLFENHYDDITFRHVFRLKGPDNTVAYAMDEEARRSLLGAANVNGRASYDNPIIKDTSTQIAKAMIGQWPK